MMVNKFLRRLLKKKGEVGETDERMSPKAVPRNPFPWSWTCHVCGSTYPLGVTRRCLEDGHYFCPSFANRKMKKEKAHCSSSFDYIGWNKHNVWRGRARRASYSQQKPKPKLLEPRGRKQRSASDPPLNRNCWDQCTFPNACKYSRTISFQLAA